MTSGSRVLLLGDASARPVGLERELSRAGFLVSEAAPPRGEHEPDAVLVTLALTGDDALRAAIASAGSDSPPVVVLVAAADRDATAAALALGADDAVAAPVHLPELCARLHARIRERQYPRSTAREGAVRRALAAFVDQGRMTLRPDEVVLALVRRLARALELEACAFVALGPDGQAPRVIAEVDRGRADAGAPSGLDPAALAAITDALRARRPVPPPVGHAIVLPAVADGRLLGVLLLRRRPEHSGLGAAQRQLAESLAEAAARALAPTGGDDRSFTPQTGPRHAAPPEAASLDRRLQEEFERARRYSLSFSLVLLDVGTSDVEVDERVLTVMGERLRRELRLPDFVSRYGAGEFAVVLPETGLDGARRSVDRMLGQLAAGDVEPSSGDLLSVGIVTYPHPAVAEADDMFALVEAALARGKAQEGERIGIAD